MPRQEEKYTQDSLQDKLRNDNTVYPTRRIIRVYVIKFQVRQTHKLIDNESNDGHEEEEDGKPYEDECEHNYSTLLPPRLRFLTLDLSPPPRSLFNYLLALEHLGWGVPAVVCGMFLLCLAIWRLDSRHPVVWTSVAGRLRSENCGFSCSLPPSLSLYCGLHMASNREALVLLIDVGPSMHNLLPEVEKVCSRLVQKKLIFGKTDEVGIVLFGTEDTDNDLEKEVGGYENVVVLQRLKVVDGGIVQGLENLPRGTANGDFLDAIVVGMDMLIKKFGPTNKGKQRLCLMTSALCPVKEPFEGTQEDQVDTISTQMKAHGMKLECVIIRGKLTGIANKTIEEENDRLLHKFSRNTIVRIVHVNSPTAVLGAIRTRKISPVTIFRGELEISSTMKIKVWVYKKTSEEKFPTLKKYSDKAPCTDKFATHEIKVDFEYKRINDPDKVVPPEQRIKGYRYGPQVVPISSDEWEAVKLKSEKSIKLLGFTDSSNIMRHHYIKDVNIFIPEPGNRKACIAVSAVANSMKEMNKVAIVRCVWRQGQGNVVIGVLTPNISFADNIPDSFYFNILPFAEDIREFQFPSFSTLPSSYQPDGKQQEVADSLVKMLDLAPYGSEESLQPDLTPNPILERYYHFLELKSRKLDADIPLLDRGLKRIVEPDPELFSQNQTVIDSFCSAFGLKENPKRRKSSRRDWKEMAQQKLEESKNRTITSESTNLSEHTVEKIGDLDPVNDFKAMLDRKDSPQWVVNAIRDMKSYIINFLDNYCEGDSYSKAIECLVALRKGCILEQEPLGFNQFLRYIYERWKTTDLRKVIEQFPSNNITFITKTEAPDSDVAEEEAKNFGLKTDAASQ